MTMAHPWAAGLMRRRELMGVMAAAGVLPVLGFTGRDARADEGLLVFD